MQKYRPMLAFPAQTPTLDARYDWEVKFDGYRCGLLLRAGEVQLISRQGTNLTRWFPELAGLHDQIAESDVLIDGEIIAGIGSVESFNDLQRRARLQGKVPAQSVHISFVAFDLLWIAGRDIDRLPLAERRNQLGAIVSEGDRIALSRVFRDGPALLKAVAANGLEGVVGKNRDAPYEYGRRSRSWLKVKIHGSWRAHNWSSG